jgi:serine/threonine protein kinase
MPDIVSRGDKFKLGGFDATIRRKLGEGSSKEVYAMDVQLNETSTEGMAVAISTFDNPYFAREVEILKDVNVKGAVIMDGPFELKDEAGRYYQATAGEHIKGQNLYAYNMGKGPQEPGETADIMGQVSRTLNSLHRAGLVHLDVKSGNIMRQSDGLCKMIDWEMVDYNNTSTDDCFGTAEYIAPEFARKGWKDITTKMDVYCAARVMEETINGSTINRHSPEITDSDEKFHRISKYEAPLTTNKDPLINLALQRASQYDPAKRGTALDMMTDLAAFPEARKHYDEEDKAQIVENLMERTKNLEKRQPMLDAAAARGMLEDLPKNHPRRLHLEAISKLSPPIAKPVKSVEMNKQNMYDNLDHDMNRSMKR